jgi:peptidoglycan hydrolase-like protein with peptidoglycan-binding domain
MAAGAVLVVVFIVAVLAFAGVFSSSTPTPAPPITPVDTNPVTTPTTTQAAAPVLPVPTAPLKPGDTGVQVKRLQRALAQLGYTIGTVDGDYGTTTKTAVEQFQTASNLTPDGLFGPATRTALSTALKASG